MSNNATGWQSISPQMAWPREKRLADMKREVARAARGGWIAFIRPALLAATYGLRTAEAEGEMMRHLQEGCDK